MQDPFSIAVENVEHLNLGTAKMKPDRQICHAMKRVYGKSTAAQTIGLVTQEEELV